MYRGVVTGGIFKYNSPRTRLKKKLTFSSGEGSDEVRYREETSSGGRGDLHSECIDTQKKNPRAF